MERSAHIVGPYIQKPWDFIIEDNVEYTHDQWQMKLLKDQMTRIEEKLDRLLKLAE